ncbi:hypothetical protein PInf_020358 [Phytophthora infestans]|nr:hypothetical protein PInf_020358 [Phytophthora infestans]
MLDVQDGYAVFREKCLAKLTALVESGEAGKRRVELQEDLDIYLKLAPPPKQADYTKPDAGNFALSLVRRRRLLTPADKTNIGIYHGVPDITPTNPNLDDVDHPDTKDGQGNEKDETNQLDVDMLA